MQPYFAKENLRNHIIHEIIDSVNYRLEKNVLEVSVLLRVKEHVIFEPDNVWNWLSDGEDLQAHHGSFMHGNTLWFLKDLWLLNAFISCKMK